MLKFLFIFINGDYRQDRSDDNVSLVLIIIEIKNTLSKKEFVHFYIKFCSSLPTLWFQIRKNSQPVSN